MHIVRLQDIQPQAVSHDTHILKRVLLGESILPGSVRLSHAVFQPGQVVEAHTHAALTEVFYVLSGDGELTVDGISHAVNAGSAFSIEAGESHALRNNGQVPLAVIYFGLKSSD